MILMFLLRLNKCLKPALIPFRTLTAKGVY
jgi:hypothetical protein